MTAVPFPKGDDPLGPPISVGSLRAGVVGLGWAGQQHMAAYADRPDVELVALAGRETDRLGELGVEYGIPAGQRFTDWPDLLARAELDIISVAAPTTLHAPIAIAALDAGLHVLSEKPLAESAAAGERMVEAAERNGRVLDVSFNHRRRGVVKALRSLVDSGDLGPIYYAKAGWVRRQGIPSLGSWFTRRATAGGGPMMDLGVHMLDIVLHLLGQPEVRTVTAATYAEFGPRGRGGAPSAVMAKTGVAPGVFDVEDLSTAFLRLSGGRTLLLECSWAQWVPAEQCYVTLYGADGGAGITWVPPRGPQSLQVWTGAAGGPETSEPGPELPPDGGHAECVADFLDLVRAGAPSRGREVLTRSVVVDACYASAESGREVVL